MAISALNTTSAYSFMSQSVVQLYLLVHTLRSLSPSLYLSLSLSPLHTVLETNTSGPAVCFQVGGISGIFQLWPTYTSS